MKLNLNKLPEKNYFSIEDICERWTCDIETINHYIYDQKILYLGLNVKNIKVTSLLMFTDENTEYLNEIFTLARHLIDPFDTSQKNIDIPTHTNDETAQKLISELKLDCCRKYKVPVKEMPKFLYEIPQDNLLLIFNDNLLDATYVTARDLDNRKYIMTPQPIRRRLRLLKHGMFNVISREERDRFEAEYGITERTQSVRKQVSKKSENVYLNLIDVLSNALFEGGLTGEPHKDAGKIERLLSKRGLNLPCTTESLAKYLKASK
jgi:hypothetical protein